MAIKNWKSILSSLQHQEDLDRNRLLWAMNEIMTGQAPDTVVAAFLMGLHTKGESVHELSALADGMASKSRPITLDRKAVDIVGTGGDQHNTVNISTMSALVIAGAGIPVIKHGNRASTSLSGTADTLEALGINLRMDVDKVEKVFRATGIGFLFAQTFHPAMRFVAPVRKQLGVPTVFNYLGPLTNPARVCHSAVGVANLNMAEKIAGVFRDRGGQHALIFRGDDGLDELTVTTSSQIWEVEGEKVMHYRFDPREFGFKRASLDELRGGDAQKNAETLIRVLDSRVEGPLTDIVLINAAAGIVCSRSIKNQTFDERFRQALTEAQESLFTGKAKAKLESWIQAGKQGPSSSPTAN